MSEHDVREQKGVEVSIDPSTSRRSLVVDRAVTKLGPSGAPEVHLACLERTSEARLRALVVVQYDRAQFVSRASSNEQFRVDAEEWLSDQNWEHEAGSYCEIPDTSPAELVVLEADIEHMVRTGDRAAILFLAVHPMLRLAAAQKSVPSLQGVLELVAHMPLAVLLDLMREWKRLANELA